MTLTTTKTPSSRGILFGRILWMAALGFLLMSAWSAWERMSIMRTWPQVDAIITSSQLEARAKDSKQRDMYAAMIGVKYTVDGREYQARVPFTDGSQRTAQAREYAERFKVGSTRKVRHAPGEPQRLRLDADYSVLFFARALAWLAAAFITGMIGTSLKRVNFGKR